MEDEHKEMQIQVKKTPAFTVLKNGSILKNIFLLRKPSPFTEQSAADTSSIDQEPDEEILLVGRHPDCNITLEHPSISRYHLRIHSNPSLHMLSVTDLSSVHGTWVSGKRIEPRVPVKLKEGDTVRMGGSSRVYELHWVPLSQAFDVDDPFVPATFKKEEETQDENSSCYDAEVEERLSSSKTGNENGEIFSTILVQSPLPSGTIIGTENQSWDNTSNETEISDSLSKSEDLLNCLRDNKSNVFELKDESFFVPNCLESSIDDTQVEHSSPRKTSIENGEIFTTVSTQSPLVSIFDNLNKSKDLSVALFDTNKTHEEEDALHYNIARGNEIDMGSENEPVNQQKINNDAVPVAPFNGLNRDEDESFNMSSEFEQLDQAKIADESDYVALFDQEIMNKESYFLGLLDETDMDQERVFTPEISRTKEVHTSVMRNTAVPANLFDSLDGKELEFFTPDKENKDPNSCSMKSLRKKWKEDEHKQSRNVLTVNGGKGILSFSRNVLSVKKKSPNAIEKVNLSIYRDEALISPEKETKSRPTEMEGGNNLINHPQTAQKNLGGAKKKWTMVVDTNSLLHNESLKHLKLLQGLKGTQLLIPKNVLRELMDIKGQHDFWKRTTKKASLALKWIEECTATTRWWIHIMDDEIKTEEAKVLETTLELCKDVKDGKILILSNDLSLKIKAMAEGIMCEAAEEFYKSLVNPFSERFMWVGSSARGLTWSCVDDVLRLKYQGFAINGFEGLKLLARITTFR